MLRLMLKHLLLNYYPYLTLWIYGDSIPAEIERFSFECRKTKTKVITLINHNSRKQSNEQIRARSKYMQPARETHVGKSRLFWFYF